MKEENKNNIISFRVTPEERALIEERSYGHYRRISDFVRDCIFKKKIVIISGLDKLAAELHPCCNNLNQLTRLANSKQIRVIDLTETKEEVAKIWQSLNSLLQSAR